MATDWVTSPVSNTGKYIFGVCIGIGIALFRIALAPTEGVAFSILIMNAFVPIIDKLAIMIDKKGHIPLFAKAIPNKSPMINSKG